MSPYFAQNHKNETITYGEGGETVYVATVHGQVNFEHELVKLLEFAKKTMKPLIIIAEDFSSEALSALVINQL